MEKIENLRIISDDKSSILNTQVKQIVTLFRFNPDDEQLLDVYETFIETNEDVSLYAPELKLAVKRKLFEYLIPSDDESIKEFFIELSSNYSFSQSFLDTFIVLAFSLVITIN